MMNEHTECNYQGCLVCHEESIKNLDASWHAHASQIRALQDRVAALEPAPEPGKALILVKKVSDLADGQNLTIWINAALFRHHVHEKDVEEMVNLVIGALKLAGVEWEVDWRNR